MSRRAKLLPAITLALLMILWAALDSGATAQSADAPEGEAAAYVPKVLGKSWKDVATDAWSVGDYPEAIFWYRKWLEASPRDNHGWYNLACTYGVVGEHAKALDALETAVDAGWEDVEHTRTDPDFAAVAENPRFLAALERAERAKAAKIAPNTVRRHVRMVTTGTYVAYLPPEYDQGGVNDERQYPLCVILHGHGSTETNHGDALAGFMGREGVIYIAIRFPHASIPTVIGRQAPAYSALPPEPTDPAKQSLHPFVQFADFIAACVDDAAEAFRVKRGRVHVIGHSMGGASALVLGVQYPALVESCFIHAGMVPAWGVAQFPDPAGLESSMPGRGGLARAKELGVSFTVSHCKGDPIVSLESAMEIVTRLKDAEIEANLITYESETHGFPPEARANAKKWADQFRAK